MPRKLFWGECEPPPTATPPRKPKNRDRRPREYLTEPEVMRLVEAAGSRGRFPWRDATLILVMYRHALRVSETVALRWDMVDFETRMIHVRRLKNGISGAQPLTGTELRYLRRWQREQSKLCGGNPPPYVFTSERGLRDTPLTRFRVGEIFAAAGIDTPGINMPIHPHMMRHACGFYLASKKERKEGAAPRADLLQMQAYLGHKNIQNTMLYLSLPPDQFDGIWKD